MGNVLSFIANNRLLIEFSDYICKVVGPGGKYKVVYHTKPKNGVMVDGVEVFPEIYRIDIALLIAIEDVRAQLNGS